MSKCMGQDSTVDIVTQYVLDGLGIESWWGGGTISKSFRKYVANVPGSHEVRELQKAAI